MRSRIDIGTWPPVKPNVRPEQNSINEMLQVRREAALFILFARKRNPQTTQIKSV
jgi:hypothetical protein